MFCSFSLFYWSIRIFVVVVGLCKRTFSLSTVFFCFCFWLLIPFCLDDYLRWPYPSKITSMTFSTPFVTRPWLKFTVPSWYPWKWQWNLPSFKAERSHYINSGVSDGKDWIFMSMPPQLFCSQTYEEFQTSTVGSTFLLFIIKSVYYSIRCTGFVRFYYKIMAVLGTV